MSIRQKVIIVVAVAIVSLVSMLAESRFGLLSGFVPDSFAVESSRSEFRFITKCVSSIRFNGAPPHIVEAAIDDMIPLAGQIRKHLLTTGLRAIDTDKQLRMIMDDIAGEPEGGRDIFVGSTVFSAARFGVEYGRFVAIRDGVTEPEQVDRVVTQYVVLSLEGLVDSLSELSKTPEQDVDEPKNGS